MADEQNPATGQQGQIDPAYANHPDVVAIRDFLIQTGVVVLKTDAGQQAQAAYDDGFRAGFSAGQASAARSGASGALETPGTPSGASEPSEGAGDPTEAPGEGAAVSLEQQVAEWWETKAHAEVQPLLAKMTEYGGVGRAEDLVAIGRQMAALQGREVTDGEATELGIFFYVTGKMGRWQTAVRDAFPVSDDTLLDIGVYVRMAQRAREVGGWPV